MNVSQQGTTLWQILYYLVRRRINHCIIPLFKKKCGLLLDHYRREAIYLPGYWNGLCCYLLLRHNSVESTQPFSTFIPLPSLCRFNTFLLEELSRQYYCWSILKSPWLSYTWHSILMLNISMEYVKVSLAYGSAE